MEIVLMKNKITEQTTIQMVRCFTDFKTFLKIRATARTSFLSQT